jgi:hypothetical protein
MYAKLFPELYTGSMLGAGCVVFAVWPYALSNCDSKGYVELNPKLLAMIFGASVQEIEQAIDFLMRPDKDSRSKTEEGRRMVKEGQFLYRHVNYEKYRVIRDKHDRRDYQREWDRKHRPSGHKRTSSPTQSDTVRRVRPGPTQVEAEADTDTDIPPLAPPRGGNAPRKKRFGEFVKLTSDEHTKLMEKFGEPRTADLIEALNNGIGSKGYKYKSHYHAILSWARKDAKEKEPDGSAELHFDGISEEEAIRLYYEMGKIDEPERDRQLAELKREG